MRAATYIMSDDLEGAEAGLGSGNSAFHKVRLHGKQRHMPTNRLMGLRRIEWC